MPGRRPEIPAVTFDEFVTVKQLAAETGIKYAEVHRKLRLWRVPYRPVEPHEGPLPCGSYVVFEAVAARKCFSGARKNGLGFTDEEAKAILITCVENGLSWRESARRLDCSTTTVKKLRKKFGVRAKIVPVPEYTPEQMAEVTALVELNREIRRLKAEYHRRRAVLVAAGLPTHVVSYHLRKSSNPR